MQTKDHHLTDISDSIEESYDHSSLPSGYVALIGRPNSGKSTLMNTILGVELAITTSKPQTTRNQILGVRTYEDEGQICFVDTPGIHSSSRALNRRMNRFAAHAVDEIDVVCHVVDATNVLRKDGTIAMDTFEKHEQLVYQTLAQVNQTPVNLVLNKIDLIKNKMQLLPLIEALTQRHTYSEVIPLSALQENNVDALTQVLLSQLPKQGFLFPEDMLTDKAERFIAAEFVRQAIMEQTHQEIPYSVAVEIERFQDTKQCLEVSAVIHLEREAQKPIVIGKHGSRIKQIGQKSRAKMEHFFDRKIFLETFVRVENQWSDNPSALDRFGYGDER